MKDMDAVRFNEKVKRASTLAGGAGGALAIAAAARFSDRDFDLTCGVWIFFSIPLILVSVLMNEILRPEDAE